MERPREGVSMVRNHLISQIYLQPSLMLGFCVMVVQLILPAVRAEGQSSEPVASMLVRINALMETDLTGALELAESALNEPWASQPEAEAKLRIQVAGLARELGDLERAKDEARRAYQLGEKLGKSELVASALNERVGVSLTAGRMTEALELAERTLLLRREIGDPAETAKILNNIGLINARTGRYADALAYYMESLRLKEEMGADHSAASTLNNLAIVRFEMGDFEASQECLIRARGIYERRGDLVGLADVLDNLGRVKREQGELDEALGFHLASLELERKLGRPEGMAISLSHAGQIYNLLGRHEEALESCAAALEINRSVGIPYGLAFSLLHFGVALSRLDQFEKASAALGEGIEFARKAGDPVILRDLHQQQAVVQSELGRFAEAYLSLEETRRLDQQIILLENADRVAELEADLQLEQKDREIDTLRLEGELRQLTIDRNEQEIVLLAQTNRVSRLTRNSLVIAFGAVVGFLIILHSRYRLKQRAEQDLMEKNAEIIRQSEMVEAQGRKIGEANRELHMSNMKLRELSRAVEQSPTGVLITDRNGAITYINPRFTEATGYALEDVRGSNPRIFKSGYHGKDFYRQLWSKIRTGSVWRGRFVNRRKDGSLYTEEATISPVINEMGEIYNYVAVMEFDLNPWHDANGEGTPSADRARIEPSLDQAEADLFPLIDRLLAQRQETGDPKPGDEDSQSVEPLWEAVRKLRKGFDAHRSVDGGELREESTWALQAQPPTDRVALVLTDRRINGRVLAALLARLNCGSVVMGDPDDPQAGADLERIDLVLIDINPGQRSARDLIDRLRAGRTIDRSRIVCISDADTPVSGDWPGADAVLARPVSMEDLRREFR